MKLVKAAGLAVLVAASGAALWGYMSYRQGMAKADRAWEAIAARTKGSAEAFDPAMIAGLPEIARRYFTHAIAPGTPLRTTVELDMQGSFLLGDVENHQSYAMQARQILAPPSEFVWIPSMRSGAMHISGSDALADATAWTQFWINSLIPVANMGTSPDMVRSARFRSAVEAIWAPASLLPGNGVRWEQIGPDLAQITVGTGEDAIVIEMTLGPDGGVRQVVGQRWSNANPESVFRYQPFGGTIEAEETFGGYTIPSLVKVGNHYGTDHYLPFFQAEITNARYL